MSVAGAAITTVSAVLFLIFLSLDLAGFQTNPYFGIVTFLLLPFAFVLGLVLMPLGGWRMRRRIARGQPAMGWPSFDFARPRVRRTAVLVVVLTGVNLAIVTMAAYKSVEYVDSNDFCTGVCHAPMEPESVAHRRSVHAGVSCVSCHVGPGAPGFVHAKTGGIRRLAAVVTGETSRPIPAPVRDLPAAADTCARCHTPQRDIGNRVREIPYYADDEATSEQTTTLTLRVGGGGFEQGGPRGIHWHASPRVQVEYVAVDATRGTIPWVRVSDDRGTREYVTDGGTPAEMAAGERRVMDCNDCHNRTGHRMAATVARAIDEALGDGLLPRSLPFMRREAVAAAGQDYPDAAAAERAIGERLRSFYGDRPEGAADPRVGQAIAATRQVYRTNVFPAMKVAWGTYPNHIGHTDSPGCFRCHDDQHKTTAGLVLSQDCDSCHRLQ